MKACASKVSGAEDVKFKVGRDMPGATIDMLEMMCGVMSEGLLVGREGCR
jgi:hypothetical protein